MTPVMSVRSQAAGNDHRPARADREGPAVAARDTARWDVHNAFLARTRSVGQIEQSGLGDENVHLFVPEDVTRVND